MTAANSRTRSVALLDADPDLAIGIDADQLAEARSRAVAALVEIDGHEWDPARLCQAADEGWLGLFVVDGLLLRRVRIAKRLACELFGPGDMLRPWDDDGDYDPLTISVDWLVLKPATVGVLDSAFAHRVLRWPSITSGLLARVAHRARYLSLLHAVTHIPRAYARLLMLFWLFAERWGTVGPDGVHVELPVTHEVLAMLVGAHRPTITIALQRLSRAGLLLRQRSDRWLLTSLALQHLAEPGGLRLLGEADHDRAGPGPRRNGVAVAAGRD